MTHICVSELRHSPIRQWRIHHHFLNHWRVIGINLNLDKNKKSYFKEIHSKMSPGKLWQICLGLSAMTQGCAGIVCDTLLPSNIWPTNKDICIFLLHKHTLKHRNHRLFREEATLNLPVRVRNANVVLWMHIISIRMDLQTSVCWNEITIDISSKTNDFDVWEPNFF